MALQYTVYPIAPKGLATSFSEAELPDDYALKFRNRFINAAGGAEKRRGIVQYGDTVPGSPNITGIHELMLPTGETVLFCSANGIIYRYDNPTWTNVYALGTNTAIYDSVQMGDRLIFTNSVDRNLYTKDGITFSEHMGVIERSRASSGTGATGLHDANITNWVTNSDVAINDLVYNQTRNAYGVITLLTTASASHTNIGPAAVGIGYATTTASSGDTYAIIDLVELNIIPTGLEEDNIALAGSTSYTSITVSAVADWNKTFIRKGDYIRNTTKNWVTQVTAFTTTQLLINRASSDVGDSLLFFRPAMPISGKAHTHFGRLYMVDSRNTRDVVVTGPDNSEDVTTDAGTLDSTIIRFGNLQPQADKLQCFASFQRFIAFLGLRNVYLFEGTDPIVDETDGQRDFNVIGLFPQGTVSRNGGVSIGNDLVYVSVDGVQSITLNNSSTTLGRSNLSEPLRKTLRDKIANTSSNNIFVFHYPRRSWLCVKIGSELYVYNYTPYYGRSTTYSNQQFDPQTSQGSWSLFDGLFAQMNIYLVIANGSLLCGGAGGKVYLFDTEVYNDDGQTYNTEYQTGWLSMEPRNASPRLKGGKYIQPVLDTGEPITYTITAEAPFNLESNDTVTVNLAGESNSIGQWTIGSSPIGGTSIVDQKIALRWRGKECRFTFSTNDTLGPDVLSRFIVFYTKHGVQ